ncbi:hypothetical protein C8R47DRAFT_1079485 [Mycena vitilis]|nr:hypothetical protein C8R47DRAFT_1079485 [Mycena vitilis]
MPSMPFMPPTASFVAEVAEPPPPLIVPLAHTDFVKPVFPSLLMHEDLGDNPIAPKNQAPKNQAPKTNVSKKMVSFLRPSRPRTSSRDYEDLTLSQISLVVPVGGASHWVQGIISGPRKRGGKWTEIHIFLLISVLFPGPGNSADRSGKFEFPGPGNSTEISNQTF